MAKSKTLETAFEELEDLIRQMENRETSLEESFKLYDTTASSRPSIIRTPRDRSPD